MIYQPKFVDSVPEDLEDKVIYISIKYSTVIHKCPCGCGNEVVTKLAPQRWRITFDGETVSLFPSVGNWGMPCQSHYWIEKNKVLWAESWSKEKIRKVQKREASENSKKNKGKGRWWDRFSH